MSYRARKVRKNDTHGVDDWLMTYADMITLLLCFFAVFLSVSVPRKEIFNEAREKVLEQFSGIHTLDGQFPSPANDAKSETLYDSLPSIVDKYHQGLGQATGDGINIGEGDQAKGHRKKPEGDRIITLEMPSAAFFSSGSATLSEEGKVLLQEIMQKNLNTDKYKDYQITVEGHTDDMPINTPQFPSNWELSTARSAAVVRFFIEIGVMPQRLRAAGFADVLPKAPNRDATGAPILENQAQNRRVIIKLEKIEKLQ